MTAGEQDLEALGLDMAKMWRQALKTSYRAQTDRILYGFSAIDANGERIDPALLVPFEHKRAAIFYR